jgi:TolB-like protein
MGAMALLLAGAWAVRYAPWLRPPDPRIAVIRFEAIGDDPAVRAFATDATDSVGGMLGEKAVGFAIQGPDAGAGPPADMLFRGAVVREDETWRVRLRLDDRASGLTLWSGEFQRPLREAAALRDEVAVAATDVAYFAMLPRVREHLQLDPQTLALFIAATRQFSNFDDHARTRRLFQQVAARAPKFAWVQGAISKTTWDAAYGASPEERPALVRQARAVAEHAIQMNPKAAEGAYDTLFQITRQTPPHDDLAQAEDYLLKGISESTEMPFLQMRECRFLIEVGRGSDALRHCEIARALRPGQAVIDASYAAALSAAGQPERSLRAAEQALRAHPTQGLARLTWAGLAMFYDDPVRTGSAFWGPSGMPPPGNPEFHNWRLFLDARQSGSAADADRTMASFWATVRAGQAKPGDLVYVAAYFGRLDDAFRALDTYGSGQSWLAGAGPSVLLEPFAAPLRRDPHFWPHAARAGYVRYWRTRNRWPDFCREPGLPFDCRAEAAKVANIAPDRT